MVKIRVIAFLILVGHSLTSWGQHIERSILLENLEVKNHHLISIMDSIVNHEKKCEYYSCELTFIVNVKVSTFDTSFTIESILDRNLALDLSPYGYLYKEGHLFLVEGDVSTELFDEQEKTKEFQFIEYDTSFPEYDSEGRRVLRVITDDSFSMWKYQFNSRNKTIEFVEGYSLCDSKGKILPNKN